VPNPYDDYLVIGALIKDQIWIWHDDNPPDRLMIGRSADFGIADQQRRHDLNAFLNATRTLRRMQRDIGECPVKLADRLRRVA
jgi:hypothetical protein